VLINVQNVLILEVVKATWDRRANFEQHKFYHKVDISARRLHIYKKRDLRMSSVNKDFPSQQKVTLHIIFALIFHGSD
jgi:hypothetical protein